MNHPIRHKYDTSIIWLYNNRKEYLLSQEFRSSIPSSTISTWRGMNYNSYKGAEYRNIQKEGIQWYELLHGYKNLQRTVIALAVAWKSIAGIVLPILSKGEQYNERFINALQRLMTVLPKKTCLKLAGLSPEAFRYRLNKLKFKCTDSPLSLCLKKHPLQLSLKEINTIEKLLSDKQFICWPVSSIAHYAAGKGYFILQKAPGINI